ncbi:uncharacterized protein LOC112269800 isoform X2 [Brachypodium distachyon]|uniref:uncharacterized protein LOC112269800 isoform X2 n=1 Tax=Brachypodium distachyon TaxID=15368 RepID=UPI000D0DEFA9|nr:uncharacterized protein LOC112269800 isoform X2 [Brachypodium distachyon]|eukprot:XP_024312767.1 uncharacterized protein LOC112269800 isoform X2 [Brachypodium distachyon]
MSRFSTQLAPRLGYPPLPGARNPNAASWLHSGPEAKIDLLETRFFRPSKLKFIRSDPWGRLLRPGPESLIYTPIGRIYEPSMLVTKYVPLNSWQFAASSIALREEKLSIMHLEVQSNPRWISIRYVSVGVFSQEKRFLGCIHFLLSSGAGPSRGEELVAAKPRLQETVTTSAVPQGVPDKSLQVLVDVKS